MKSEAGDVWTASGGGGYAGKPRPAVIIQDDRFAAIDSVTLCLLTTDPTPAELVRPEVAPTEANGLRHPSRLMVDKIGTLPKTKLERRVGCLSDADMASLDRAVLIFFGLSV